ncbi:MAG: DUF1819 family protein [SAR324 cluster bacterium]|nr:DUF1819 family protein [SAR324 cluster bacterium]
MNHDRYSLSFTSGTLFHQNSVQLVELFFVSRDWVRVREEVILRNLLQSRTQNALKRICREIMIMA